MELLLRQTIILCGTMDSTEITVFSYGNAQDPQTWSNVPYCATKALEKEGITVNYVDIGPHSFLGTFFIKGFNKCSRLMFGNNTLLLFQQFKVFRLRGESIVKKAIKSFPNSDLLLFFSYSLNGKKVSDIPSVLFCDFTIEYAIRNIFGREPTKVESKLISRQDQIIESSDLMISLFPKATEHYREYYSSEGKIYGILGHVINCLIDLPQQDVIIKEKYESKSIVFIGRKKYKRAAITLVNAVESYNLMHEEKVIVEIIGMTSKEMGGKQSENVKCYGVLNKASTEEMQLYYEIMLRAKVIVNTAARWAGISSIVEAMWLFTPIITSEYKDFNGIFGNKIFFGSYCKAEDQTDLNEKISWIMDRTMDEYYQMCINAHQEVQDFTWESCIRKMIEEWHQRGLLK